MSDHFSMEDLKELRKQKELIETIALTAVLTLFAALFIVAVILPFAL